MFGECVWITTGQRIVMAPSSLVENPLEKFRLAEAGEPQTPVWMENTLCMTHEETSFEWRPISPDRLAAVQAAINARCAAGCRCGCHNAAGSDPYREGGLAADWSDWTRLSRAEKVQLIHPMEAVGQFNCHECGHAAHRTICAAADPSGECACSQLSEEAE